MDHVSTDPAVAALPLRQYEINQWRVKLLDPDSLDRIDFLRIGELINRLEAVVPAGVIRPFDEPVTAEEVAAARAPFESLSAPITMAAREIATTLLLRMETVAQCGQIPKSPGNSFSHAVKVLRTKDRITYDERQTIAAVFNHLSAHLKPGMFIEAITEEVECEMASDAVPQ